MLPIKHKQHDILFVNDENMMRACVLELSKQNWIAIDTEFERKKVGKFQNYKLSILQIGIPNKVYLIDMLAKLKFNKLFEILENNKILKIIHSPSEDIRLLQEKKCYIQNIFDTQKAAILIGVSSRTESLNSLLNKFLNISIDKSEQQSEWLNRPLSVSQLKYATVDVIYLKDLKDKLDLEIQKQNLAKFINAEFKYDCNLYRIIKRDEIKSSNNNLSEFNQYLLKGLLDFRYNIAVKHQRFSQDVIPYKILVEVIYEKLRLDDWEEIEQIWSKIRNSKCKKQIITFFKDLKDEAADLKLAKIPYRNISLISETEENTNPIINEFEQVRNAISDKYNPIFANYIISNKKIKLRIDRNYFEVSDIIIKNLIEETAREKNINIENFKITIMKYVKSKRGAYNKARLDKKANFKNIVLSKDGTHFLIKNKKAFGKTFKEALKFHEPGLAPVCDASGWYHINTDGKAMYGKRYKRTFGYYNGRAAVIDQDNNWFHIKAKGERCYTENFAWCGNYQEKLCTVRDFNDNYFHLNILGKRAYKENYIYAGDFKDGYASVRLENGFYKHIDYSGKELNGKLFKDLGIFHKNFATAKDENGWFHINKKGNELYSDRYALIEPFYNGFALVEDFKNEKKIIDEEGKIVIVIN